MPFKNNEPLPRVAQADDTATPRVQRLSRLKQNNTNKWHLQIYSRGEHVYKKFRLKYYQGNIHEFDPREGYYKVKYNDGDSTEYRKDEIKKMVHNHFCARIYETHLNTVPVFSTEFYMQNVMQYYYHK